MNKVIQLLFLALFPLFPLWGWASYSLTSRHVSLFTCVIFIPLIFYILIYEKARLPKYLLFYIFFTIFHLASVFINDLAKGQNLIYFILTDINVVACVVLFVVENTKLDRPFISNMNIMLLIAVAVSAIVSIMQIPNSYFFINPELTQSVGGILYLEERRNFSIYSWINLNSVGITFPIIISILLSYSNELKKSFPFVILGGIIVAFLTRARYVMISTIIVLSQLFFISKIELKKKVYILLLFIVSISLLLVLANIYGFDIQRVVSDRILEQRTGMGSFKARIISFEVFKLKFPEHPVLGVGPSTRADVVQLLGGVAPLIHIGYLSYLYFYGIAGSMLLFLSLFFMLKDSWDVGKKHGFWGTFYGLLSFLFANVTFVYFNLGESGLILALIYMKYYKDKNTVTGKDEESVTGRQQDYALEADN